MRTVSQISIPTHNGSFRAKVLLEHGYLGKVEHWGSDEGIIEAARMSTDKGFLGWEPRVCDCVAVAGQQPGADPMAWSDPNCPLCNGSGKLRGDKHLLSYLYRNNHATPFEMAGLVIEVQAPIMVFREWHRHRTQCLAGDTMLHFQRPDNGRVYKMPISEVWRKWQETTRSTRPERQTNALWSRNRIAGMALRCVNEETKEVVLTRVVDAIKSEAKHLYRLTTEDSNLALVDEKRNSDNDQRTI